MRLSTWMSVQRRSVHSNVIGRLLRVTDCRSPTEPSPYIMQSNNNRRQSRVHGSRSGGTHLLLLHSVLHRLCIELPELKLHIHLPDQYYQKEIYRAIKNANTLSREIHRM